MSIEPREPYSFPCTDDSPLNTGRYYRDEIDYPYEIQEEREEENDFVIVGEGEED